MRTLRILSFFALLFLAFSSCQKEYSLEGGTISLLPGTWEFRDSNALFRGNMDTGFVETSGSTKTLTLQGTSFDGLEDFLIILSTNNSGFTTGTYMASNGEAIFEYSKNNTLLYESNQLNGEFIVTISSISATSVTGTFTGFARDSAQKLKTITAGKFTTRYNSGTVISPTTAVGTLGSTAGACTPTLTSGTYTQGVPTDATNTAQVTATVTTAGIYTINTNTVNGVTFSKSGTFANTGTQTVTLQASGTPTASGTFTYNVSFGTSTCSFTVTYAGGTTTTSVGTLGGGPGSCTPATPAGTYTQGTALTSANTVTISATVTTPGTYTITTNAVNGVTFSKSGVFTATGAQSVVLQGTGTPVNSGAQTYTLTYGTSTCTFTITYAAGTTPPVQDWFPTTNNSNWVYYALTGLAYYDSAKTTATALTTSFGGNTYTRFHTIDLTPGATGTDTTYFRKTTNDYYELMDMQFFFGFDAPQYGEVNFLKDNQPVGTTWNSPTFSGTVSGVPASGNFKYTIIATGTTATIGTQSFTNVIKVKTEITFTLSTTSIVVESWYAKGVGLIYQDFGGFDQENVVRYQVF